MSAALTASTAPLAKLSAPARSQLQQRRRAQAAVVTSSSSSGVVHDGKNTANNNSLAAASLARRVALGAATVAVPLLAIAQPAHAMEGALAVFNGNPALVRGEKRGLFLQKQRSLQKKKKKRAINTPPSTDERKQTNNNYSDDDEDEVKSATRTHERTLCRFLSPYLNRSVARTVLYPPASWAVRVWRCVGASPRLSG